MEVEATGKSMVASFLYDSYRYHKLCFGASVEFMAEGEKRSGRRIPPTFVYVIPGFTQALTASLLHKS